MPRWFGYIPMNTNIEDGETVRLNPDDGHTFESHKYTDDEDLGAAALSNSYGDLDDLPTLGSASEQDSSAFATSTQGAKADSAVQPGDLAEVASSGSYNDLEDRPTIPAAFSQVNADWNATSGAGQILNKPTIPTVRREEVHVGTTNSSGRYTVTYSTPFAQVPFVQPMINADSAYRLMTRVVSSDVNGFTVEVVQRNVAFLSLLGLNLMSEGVTVQNAVSVMVKVTAR